MPQLSTEQKKLNKTYVKTLKLLKFYLHFIVCIINNCIFCILYHVRGYSIFIITQILLCMYSIVVV